jgi:hypothetical protein
VKLATTLATWRGRRLLLSTWRRMTRWEFWPLWVFYPPVVLYIIWLGFRHRSPLLFTCANPAIPGGGLAGESKHAILGGLGNGGLVGRNLLLPDGEGPGRFERLEAFMQSEGLHWPVVLKPDVGERGLGVAFVRSRNEALDYLERARFPVIAQERLAGPEFGVFYYRLPGEDQGRVFAITEKHFPEVVGDGVHTLEELILADDRAVGSARAFLRRHADRLDWVPFLGQTVPLTELGTHSRGALFLDGAHLLTPELETAIDGLSRGYEGFWFGRYDLRVPDTAALRSGAGFKILELNGVSSEATSIYDPAHNVGHAWRTLFQQWRIAFEIGKRNRALGARPTSLREILRLVRHHRRMTRQVREAMAGFSP